MDQCTHEVRMQHWKNIIMQCQNREEGVTASTWLKENGICQQTYYAWLKRIRQDTYNQMKKTESLPVVQENEVSFAEVRVTPQVKKTMDPLPDESFSPSAIIKAPNYSIALTNDISEQLLMRILQEVSHA